SAPGRGVEPPRQAARRGRAALRPRLGWREGGRQARRPPAPRRTCRHRAHRRQDGRAAARREPARLRRRAAVGRRRRGCLRGRRRVRRLRRRGPAGWVARPRHRPGHARGVRGEAHRCSDDLLERADGRVRVAALRRGDEGRRGSGGRQRRGVHRRRRRRLGARAERAGPRRPHLVGLDRRRREPRAARGQGAPGRRRDSVVIIAGNWKMFRGPDPHALGGLDAIVAPPFTRLRDCVDAGLTTYAQNVHWEAEGAFTGEISAPMLLELGVTGALVGHSERRQYFGETDETVALRTHAALEAGLHVIACVGETLAEREGDQTEDVLRRQLAVLEPHPHLVLAYEPVWAIGTGLTATPEMAQDAHAFIKSLLDAPVLYGGSVKPDNAAGLLAQPDVDGALVGGASLDVDSFKAICAAAARIPS